MADGKKINLIVVTPYRNFYEGFVSSVTIKSLDGDIGIMAGHSPMVVALVPGVCTVRIDDDYKYFVCSEGYAEIGQKLALIVCNSAEWPEDIDIVQAINSYKEACANTDKQLTKDMDHKKQRAKARLHLVELHGSDKKKERLSALLEESPLS